MALVAPPPGANEAHTFPAVANGKDTGAECTISCPPKRAVCSAVGFAPFELQLFGHDPTRFEPKLFETAPHTLLVAWLRRATHVLRGSATWSQSRPHLPSGGQPGTPSRPARTTRCQAIHGVYIITLRIGDVKTTVHQLARLHDRGRWILGRRHHVIRRAAHSSRR